MIPLGLNKKTNGKRGAMHCNRSFFIFGVLFLLADDFKCNISRIGCDFAPAARNGIRHVDFSRIGFCDEYLFGQQAPFDIARVGFYKDFGGIAGVKIHTAGASLN